MLLFSNTQHTREKKHKVINPDSAEVLFFAPTANRSGYEKNMAIVIYYIYIIDYNSHVLFITAAISGRSKK